MAAFVVTIVVFAVLFGIGFKILKVASRPSTPSPSLLPAAQVMADRHSPLRSKDPAHERRIDRVILTIVGICFILAALGVFGLGLAIYALS